MKRLFIGAVTSCMLIFIIWSIVAYVNYGSDMVNYRLDLFATFSKFSESVKNKFDYSLYDLLTDFRNGIEKMLNFSLVGSALNAIGNNVSTIPTGFQVVLTVLLGFVEPIWTLFYSAYVLIYLIAIVAELVIYILSFIFAVYEFVLNPVFIHV